MQQKTSGSSSGGPRRACAPQPLNPLQSESEGCAPAHAHKPLERQIEQSQVGQAPSPAESGGGIPDQSSLQRLSPARTSTTLKSRTSHEHFSTCRLSHRRHESRECHRSINLQVAKCSCLLCASAHSGNARHRSVVSTPLPAC
jgi:hypothetical protein